MQKVASAVPLQRLKKLLQENDLPAIKKSLSKIITDIGSLEAKGKQATRVDIKSSDKIFELPHAYFKKELLQICETKTIERTKYYLKRLLKGISEVKTGKVNDINLNRWKEYDDIITDSLWVVKKRDNSGYHSAGYWGNFIPQIPNQFIRRYTKKGEWVLDAFLGSGTTLMECQRLGRHGIGVEIQPKIVTLAKKNISLERKKIEKSSQIEIFQADSSKVNYEEKFKKIGVTSVQLVIMHPPYWDIIKFSEDKRDLSNADSIDAFLRLLGEAAQRARHVLDDERYLVLVIGDKYADGEWIPLGFYAMNEVLKKGFKLKSTIVKNFEETKGKMNQKELWRYRALVGGYYIFKHEYIFLFQKKKKPASASRSV